MFPIVDQINLGLRCKTPAMRVDVARLNLEAGLKCFEQSANATAKAYLNHARLFLPNDHWESQYSLSLQLYFLLAKSSYSCGHGDEAHSSLLAILKEGRCIEDKVDAYYLLMNIHHAREGEESLCHGTSSF